MRTTGHVKGWQPWLGRRRTSLRTHAARLAPSSYVFEKIDPQTNWKRHSDKTLYSKYAYCKMFVKRNERMIRKKIVPLIDP